jgi:hypothetical protein
MEDAARRGLIEGVRICSRAPFISHLFFADDSLIFIKASVSGSMHLQQILSLYENASGQMINKDKTAAMFSKNTPTQVKSRILAELGISHTTTNDRYLGLPVHIGKLRRKSFEYIKQKVWTRIQGWQEKLLSKAGKEILIKAVVQAIPTYAMSCFDLTKGFCEELSSMIARYFFFTETAGESPTYFFSFPLNKRMIFTGLKLQDITPQRKKTAYYNM